MNTTKPRNDTLCQHPKIHDLATPATEIGVYVWWTWTVAITTVALIVQICAATPTIVRAEEIARGLVSHETGANPSAVGRTDVSGRVLPVGAAQ